MIFISSFEINKKNLFPALTVLFTLIFVSNLFVAFEAKLLTNIGELSPTKGIAIFVSAFIPNLVSQNQRNPSH